MTGHRVRVLDKSELRAANTLFRESIHYGSIPDEQWDRVARSYPDGRVLGAHDGNSLIGTAMSYPSRLAVPGGATVSLAAVSRIGVRADQTRRGILTSLMRSQLDMVAAGGDLAASLHASEALVYGRFGYGVANRARTVSVDTRRATLRPSIAMSGSVRNLTRAEMVDIIPLLYERIGLHRPGMISRPDPWWQFILRRALDAGEFVRAAVHTGERGDDGFVVYRTPSPFDFDDSTHRVVIEVQDMHAATFEASAGLWAYLIGIDLADEIHARLRPLDEPVELMLVDFRGCRTTELVDETWLRLVNVPAALAARTYRAADPLVIDVVDQFLPDNSGRYLIEDSGVARTDRPAHLAMDVDTLGMLYLNGFRASDLAAVGRITAYDRAAAATADRLFGSDTFPWCGTFF